MINSRISEFDKERENWLRQWDPRDSDSNDAQRKMEREYLESNDCKLNLPMKDKDGNDVSMRSAFNPFMISEYMDEN